MWSRAPSFASAVTAAVLCLLGAAPHTARACVADNDSCCMVSGVGVCDSTEVVCVNNNRCRPCGGLNEFECIGVRHSIPSPIKCTSPSSLGGDLPCSRTDLYSRPW